MNGHKNREHLLQELQDMLDLMGASPERWPEAQRAKLSAFVETDVEAARLFAETKALDRLLDHAPAGDGPGLAGLEARILAALPPASRVSHSANGVPMPLPARGRHIAAASREAWQALVLLAASLILGIFIGMSGRTPPVLNDINLVASVDTEVAEGIARALLGSGTLREQEQL